MKKSFAILLSIVMLLALAACGTTSNDQPAGSSAPPSQSAPPASSDQPAPPPSQSAPPAVSDQPAPADQPPQSDGNFETLKVGALIHLTDWFAAVDMTNYYEFNAMVSYINDDLGGWKIGDKMYKLEPVIVDGRSNPEALRAGAMSLVDAGVNFVSVTNDFWVISCQDVFEDAGVMELNNYLVYVPDYMGPNNPMTFSGNNGSVGDYAAGFEALHSIYPDVKSVIFVNDDNGVNEQLFALMKTYGAQYGIDVLDDYLKYSGDTTDYSAIALQIVNSGADAFMGNGAPDAYGAILKEVRALGSDIVMACIQGKPISMIMDYVPESARYNGFSFGASTRASDMNQNTDIMNGIVAKVRELFGDDQASNFDGAACNNLYIVLQCMQIAGSTDPKEVAKAWENQSTINTLFGTGTMGGLETYGIANHAVGNPRPVCIMDPSAEGGWQFWGWLNDVIIP